MRGTKHSCVEGPGTKQVAELLCVQEAKQDAEKCRVVESPYPRLTHWPSSVGSPGDVRSAAGRLVTLSTSTGTV